MGKKSCKIDLNSYDQVGIKIGREQICNEIGKLHLQVNLYAFFISLPKINYRYIKYLNLETKAKTYLNKMRQC